MSIISKIMLYLLKFKHLGKKISVGKDVKIIHPENIVIGNNVLLDSFCRLQTWPEYHGKPTEMTPQLTIGDNVSFMRNCQVSCVNKIVIGDGCLFGDNVFITDNFHGDNSFLQLSTPPLERPLASKGAVVLGSNIWIGRNVCIMPGVEIGDHVVIGANSVVTHSIKSNTIAAGVPATIIRNINMDIQ